MDPRAHAGAAAAVASRLDCAARRRRAQAEPRPAVLRSVLARVSFDSGQDVPAPPVSGLG
jgi:hypothetical protein